MKRWGAAEDWLTSKVPVRRLYLVAITALLIDFMWPRNPLRGLLLLIFVLSFAADVWLTHRERSRK